MTMQPPPPPSISPHQMILLRIVASMAWSDGSLAAEEVQVMLDRFSSIFVNDSQQQQQVRQELQDYLMQNIPLEELTPRLQGDSEKELVLKLGYQVIQASARTPSEEKINQEEAAAYQTLVKLLDLPVETVQRIQTEATAELAQGEHILDHLTRNLQKFAE
jgi:hypothetical protein